MANQYTTKTYSSDEINEIISQYNSGMPITKISLLLNRKKNNIKKILSEGFKNNIKPQIIADLNNFEFIPWEENVKKRTKCSITKEELITI